MERQHLAESERHVRDGALIVARQRELVARLERDGHDTHAARALLAQFEELQALHIADCERRRNACGADIPVRPNT